MQPSLVAVNNFQVRPQSCKSDSYLRYACPLVHPSSGMEHLISLRTYLYAISYLSIFRNCDEKIQVSLTSDKNNGYLTWRPMYICDNISLNSSWNENYFTHKLQRKSKHTHCICSFFFRISYRVWKNVEICGRAIPATDNYNTA